MAIRVPLADPRIPIGVADVCKLAVEAGLTVDTWEQTTGNPRKPVAVVVVVWTPWGSDFAKILRANGANDTAMDQCAALESEDHQSVSWREPMPAVPALFRLIREVDETGVSGTGHVADGVVWHDGTVAVRWRTDTRSTVVYDSLADVEKIHGHGGKTRVVWG